MTRTIVGIIAAIFGAFLILLGVALFCRLLLGLADSMFPDPQPRAVTRQVTAVFLDAAAASMIIPERPAIAHPSPYLLDASTVAQVICSDFSAGTAFYLGSGRYMTAAHVLTNEKGVLIKCWIGGQVVTIEHIDIKRDYALARADHYLPYRATVSCERLQQDGMYLATGFANGNGWPVTTLLRAAGLHDPESGTAEANGALVDGMSGGPVADFTGAVHAINDWRDENGAPAGGVVELADTTLCQKS